MNLTLLESLESADSNDINNYIFMICDFCFISTERVKYVTAVLFEKGITKHHF